MDAYWPSRATLLTPPLRSASWPENGIYNLVCSLCNTMRRVCTNASSVFLKRHYYYSEYIHKYIYMYIHTYIHTKTGVPSFFSIDLADSAKSMQLSLTAGGFVNKYVVVVASKPTPLTINHSCAFWESTPTGRRATATKIAPFLRASPSWPRRERASTPESNREQTGDWCSRPPAPPTRLLSAAAVTVLPEGENRLLPPFLVLMGRRWTSP